jgi:hypothetical protein
LTEESASYRPEIGTRAVVASVERTIRERTAFAEGVHELETAQVA